MTALAQSRDEQARLGEFLREHAAWRDSDEMVETPFGRMMARTAYAGALDGQVRHVPLWSAAVARLNAHPPRMAPYPQPVQTMGEAQAARRGRG